MEYNLFSFPGIADTTKHCRLRAAGKTNADGVKKTRTRERAVRRRPAPEANAELQANLDVCHLRFIFQRLLYMLTESQFMDKNLRLCSISRI